MLKILLFFLLFITGFNLKAQDKRTLTCSLLHSSDSTPVAYAHIVNHKNKTGTSSNINGEFNITVYNNDSLMISKIGFQTLTFSEKNITKIIYLTEKKYELDQFSVLPYRNYKEFKEAFASIKLPDDKHKLNRSIFLSIEELKHYDGSRGFGGGISGLLGLFNKHMKDKKNYERLLAQDKYEEFLATKFNPNMVVRLTKLEKNEAKLFMEYCDFSNGFIEKASDYDLITQIFDCYDEYNSLPITSK